MCWIPWKRPTLSLSLSLWWMILMVGGWLVLVLGLWIPTTRGVKGPPPLAWSVAVFLCLFMHSNWTIPRGDCNYNTIITRAKRVQLQRYNISIFEMMFQKNCKQVLLFSYSFVFFS